MIPIEGKFSMTSFIQKEEVFILERFYFKELVLKYLRFEV